MAVGGSTVVNAHFRYSDIVRFHNLSPFCGSTFATSSTTGTTSCRPPSMISPARPRIPCASSWKWTWRSESACATCVRCPRTTGPSSWLASTGARLSSPASPTHDALRMGRGDRIDGRFELRERAGIGGMGEVFQALDTKTDRLVALKILRDASDRDRVRARGARAGRAPPPRHRPPRRPWRPPPRASPTWPWSGWRARTSPRSCARRRLDRAEALTLAARVAECARRRRTRTGSIHRDIKPANLFLVQAATSARPELLDFGIARLAGQTRVTRTGAVARHARRTWRPSRPAATSALTPRADVFALGCVLFECLDGHARLRRARTWWPSWRRSSSMEAPRAGGALPGGRPRELDALIARMLAKDPAAVPRRRGAARGARGLTARGARGPASAFGLGARDAGPPPVALTGERAAHGLGRDDRPRRRRAAAAAEATTLAAGRRRGARASRRAAAWSTSPTARSPSRFDGARRRQGSGGARGALRARPPGRQPGAPVALATGRGDDSQGDHPRRGHRAGARSGSSSRTRRARQRRCPWPSTTRRRRCSTRASSGERARRGRSSGASATGRRRRGRCSASPRPAWAGRCELARARAGLRRLRGGALGARSSSSRRRRASGKSRLAHEFVRAIRRRAPEAAIWLGRADSTRAGSSLHLLAPGAARRPGHPRAASRSRRGTRSCGRAWRGTARQPRSSGVASSSASSWARPSRTPGSAQLRAARAGRAAHGRADAARLRGLPAGRVRGAPGGARARGSALGRRRQRALRGRGAAQRSWIGPSSCSRLARPEVHARFPGLWSERGLQEIHLRALLTQGERAAGARGARRQRVAPSPWSGSSTQADGNAFYLEELIRAVAEGKSARCRTRCWPWCRPGSRRSEPDARRVLRAASVFGEVFWQGAASPLLGGRCARQQVDGLARAPDEREVLGAPPESRFPGEERVRLPPRAAPRGGLRDAHRRGPRPRAPPRGRVARAARARAMRWCSREHFERGGELERAVHHYVRAADHASEADDAEAILSCVERGLRCNPRGEPRGPC